MRTWKTAPHRKRVGRRSGTDQKLLTAIRKNNLQIALETSVPQGTQVKKESVFFKHRITTAQVTKNLGDIPALCSWTKSHKSMGGKGSKKRCDAHIFSQRDPKKGELRTGGGARPLAGDEPRVDNPRWRSGKRRKEERGQPHVYITTKPKSGKPSNVENVTHVERGEIGP